MALKKVTRENYGMLFAGTIPGDPIIVFTVLEGDALVCNCQAFKAKKTCTHVDKTLARFGPPPVEKH